MKLTIIEDLTLQLEQVFTGITLKSESGETMSICMRDTGFEFNYQGKQYFAKNGIVDKFPTMSTVNLEKFTELEKQYKMEG
jgi:hypothetical protein